MSRFNKPILIVCGFFGLITFFPNSIKAQALSSNLTSTYVLSQFGQLNTTHSLEIINNSDLRYFKSSTLNFNESAVGKPSTETSTNLKALVTGQDPVIFSLESIDPLVGNHKGQVGSITFQTKNNLNFQTDHYQLQIDPLVGHDEINQTIKVILPKNLEKPLYIEPKVEIISTELGYELNYPAKLSSSIYISNRDQLNLKLVLPFTLTNPYVSNVETELVLPPDTPYQQIVSLESQPNYINLTLDKKHNRVATYRLEPKSNFNGTITTHINLNHKSNQSVLNYYAKVLKENFIAINLNHPNLENKITYQLTLDDQKSPLVQIKGLGNQIFSIMPQYLITLGIGDGISLTNYQQPTIAIEASQNFGPQISLVPAISYNLITGKLAKFVNKSPLFIYSYPYSIKSDQTNTPYIIPVLIPYQTETVRLTNNTTSIIVGDKTYDVKSSYRIYLPATAIVVGIIAIGFIVTRRLLVRRLEK